MTDPDPMACSLDGPELDARLAAASDAGRAALISYESSDGRHLLRFTNTPAIRARIEEIVDAERSCCSFLSLELAEDDDQIVLAVEGPPGGEPAAAALVAAFALSRPRTAGASRT
ncbi:MAG TPA: hypothetical protein VH476_08230 [Solirubrobacterales bacterium]